MFSLESFVNDTHGIHKGSLLQLRSNDLHAQRRA